MQFSLEALLKADPHVHIEGAVSPANARTRASGNDISLPDGLFSVDDSYVYGDFVDLVTRVYDTVAGTMRTARDYEEVTYDYLKKTAAENCIFTGFIVSPDRCERLGLPYPDMLAGMTKAIDSARDDFKVEARMRATLVRHLPDADIARAARLIINNPHPYVRKIDLAGAEKPGDMTRFLSVLWKIISESNGHIEAIDAHGAEIGGSENLRQLMLMPEDAIQSVGHGIQVMNDPALVRKCRQRGIVFEVSLTSNILAGIFPNYASHPLPQMLKAGLNVSLATDDPGLFDCTITDQYRIALDQYEEVTPETLLASTRNAIVTGGLDEPTRRRLLDRVNSFAASNKRQPSSLVGGPG